MDRLATEKRVISQLSFHESKMGWLRGKVMKKIRRRCLCGCGKITNYGKKYINGHNGRKLKIQKNCACGCGQLARHGKKYINGHQRRGKTPTKETIDKTKRTWESKRKKKIRRMCGCGCGGLTNFEKNL